MAAPRVCVLVSGPSAQFPLEGLDMRPFVPADLEGGCVYDLSAVVCHHGSSVDTGHYTAFCKDAQRSEFCRLVCVSVCARGWVGGGGWGGGGEKIGQQDSFLAWCWREVPFRCETAAEA
jgi:hypothetical protein